MANKEIRLKAKFKEVAFWELAKHLDISESTLTRKMRNELSDNEKTDMLNAIDEIVQARA